MSLPSLKIVILGLSITSSWGNGHATTYRSLVRELDKRGHDVLFLERDMPWYSSNRDLPRPPYGRTKLYFSLDELKKRFAEEIGKADFVMVGSYVPEGNSVSRWVLDTARGATAFYDIDTPVTLSKLERNDDEYISAGLIPHFDLYLSFTGGKILKRIEEEFGSPMARPLYCSVDTGVYIPMKCRRKWALGYLGTYSEDRQPVLDSLMLEPARRSNMEFVVAGPLYPKDIVWSHNVERIEHLPPKNHSSFYNSMDFTLNITRADMVRAGYSPSVRLFEAASCATPVISDWWEGIDSFFKPDEEILISKCPEDTMRFLTEVSEKDRMEIGRKARERILSAHTSAHRVNELECYMKEVLKKEEV